ncbi:FYN-binding protein 2 [Ctenodactylus gundi]
MAQGLLAASGALPRRENSQKASLLIDMNRSNANVTEDEKEKMNNSFRDKLRKWEDVLSQKSQVSSADLLTNERRPEVRRDQHPKTKPLPSVGYLGPPPPKPPKPPVVNLWGFQRQPEAISSSHQEVTMREASHPPESAEFEEPHNYEATISCLSHSDKSINLGTAEEIADSTYEVEIEELPKNYALAITWTLSLSFVCVISSHFSPEPEDGDKNQAEEEPRKVEPQAAAKDLDPKRPVQVGVCSGTPGNMPTTGAHGDQWSLPGGTQETTSSGIINTNVCSQDMKLAWPPQSQGVCVQALEASEDTPVSGLLNTSPVSEEMYDDVDCTRSKWDFSNSLASESEGNSEEMYEDIYKTSNNFPKAESDGKEALQRFQQFFQKGKDRFKMKIKPKEHLRNFFRAKLPNLEKIRMGREEKLFRERFQYDKEIAVINRAVACSSNSGGGALDLPITPGEELDVIDTTEQNLVICRNSKGKYGYVLIEHLNFK